MMVSHWLAIFGIPRTICSDCGPQFTGGSFKAMCSLMGILTRLRGGAGHGTLRWTRTSKQAGKALRSQGHHHARVM